MSEQDRAGSSGELKPVRYSLRDLTRDAAENAVSLGGVGGRVLDQHEIDRLFANGNSDDNTRRD